MFEPGTGQCIMHGTKCIIVANSSCMLITASTAMCILYVQAWDDVERKARPVDKMSVYSKKTVLDQEKSKLSLSQIYEQQFLKQTQVCVAMMLWRGQWYADGWLTVICWCFSKSVSAVTILAKPVMRASSNYTSCLCFASQMTICCAVHDWLLLCVVYLVCNILWMSEWHIVDELVCHSIPVKYLPALTVLLYYVSCCSSYYGCPIWQAIIFCHCGFFLLSSFFLAYSQQSQIGCLPYFHTWCGLSANLECRSEMWNFWTLWWFWKKGRKTVVWSEMCCTWLTENRGHKNLPSPHSFGWAAITLGIGPHSSWFILQYIVYCSA